jgi:hypothetical protein
LLTKAGYDVVVAIKPSFDPDFLIDYTQASPCETRKTNYLLILTQCLLNPWLFSGGGLNNLICSISLELFVVKGLLSLVRVFLTRLVSVGRA